MSRRAVRDATCMAGADLLDCNMLGRMVTHRCALQRSMRMRLQYVALASKTIVKMRAERFEIPTY